MFSPKKPAQVAPLAYVDLRGIIGWGFCVFLFLAPFLRGLFFAPEQFQAEVYVGVLMALAGVHFLLRREAQGFDLTDILAVALLGTYLFTLFFTAVDKEAALETTMLLGMGVGVYFLASRFLAGTAGATRVLWAVYLSATGVTALGFLNVAGLVRFPWTPESGMLDSTFQYHNTFGAFALCGFLLGLGLAARTGEETGDSLRRAALVAGNVLLVLGLLASQSRGAWLVAPFGLLAFFWAVRGEERREALTGLLWTLGASLLLAAPMLRNLWAENGRVAVLLLAGSMVLAGGGYLAHRHFLTLWLQARRFPPEFWWLLRAAGAVYLGAVLAFFVYYEASLPTPALGNLLSGSVAARAQSIGTDAATTRIYYQLAGLNILLHHPLGVGGGGYNALYHRYQGALFYSTQAHDGFLQVGVEGGILALCLLLVLVGRLFWNLRPGAVAAGLPAGTAGGLLAAAVALVLHSFGDFDLTFGAMLALLWLLFGLARRPWRPFPLTRAGPAIVLLAGLVLLVPAWCLYQAGADGAAGARAMTARKYGTALSWYGRAISLDPWQPTFRMDTAEMEIGLARALGNRRLWNASLASTAVVGQLAPDDIPLALRANQVYLLADAWQRAAATARALVAMDPLEPIGYDNLAHTLVVAAAGELQQGSLGEARKLIGETEAMPEVVAAGGRRVNQRENGQIYSPPPAVDNQISLAMAQGDYLAGRFRRAKGELATLLTQDSGGQVAPTARIWLAADEVHLGDGTAAQAVMSAAGGAFAKTKKELNRVVQLGYFLGKGGG